MREPIENLGTNLAYIQGEAATLLSALLELQDSIMPPGSASEVQFGIVKKHSENILKVHRKATQYLKEIQATYQRDLKAFPLKERAFLVLTKAGANPPPVSHLSIGSWECPDPDDRHHASIPNPLGVCVYDQEGDPALDCCLFCGNPDERK